MRPPVLSHIVSHDGVSFYYRQARLAAVSAELAAKTTELVRHRADLERAANMMEGGARRRTERKKSPREPRKTLKERRLGRMARVGQSGEIYGSKMLHA